MRKNEVFDSEGNVVESVDAPYTQQEWASIKEQYYRQRLNGGITVDLGGGDVDIPTKEDDRSLINGAVSRALLDGDDTLEYDYFPVGGGRITLTNAAFKAIGRAIADHVQKCLDAGEVTSGVEYDTPEDFESAWEAAYDAA